jgi:hypothetical protein
LLHFVRFAAAGDTGQDENEDDIEESNPHNVEAGRYTYYSGTSLLQPSKFRIPPLYGQPYIDGPKWSTIQTCTCTMLVILMVDKSFIKPYIHMKLLTISPVAA